MLAAQPSALERVPGSGARPASSTSSSSSSLPSFAVISPQVGASARTLDAFYNGDRARIIVAAFFSGLNLLNLLWFAAALRTTLADVGQDGWGSAPTLVIWGQRDNYLGPELAQPDHDDVPNLDRVERLPDASHWVHHDEAQRVTQLLAEFFAPAVPARSR